MVVPFLLRGMQADRRGQGWTGWFADVLTAAVPDGFLMCPMFWSWYPGLQPALPAETCLKTLIKRKCYNKKEILVWPHVSTLLCVCFIPWCLVYLFVRCFDITIRSTLKDRFKSFSTVRKDPIFQKYPPAHIVCRCGSTDWAQNRCVYVFLHRVFTPSCSDCAWSLRWDM